MFDYSTFEITYVRTMGIPVPSMIPWPPIHSIASDIVGMAIFALYNFTNGFNIRNIRISSSVAEPYSIESRIRTHSNAKIVIALQIISIRLSDWMWRASRR
ncbi:hypothetical protein DERP_000880 [Dermatophagoides pteronyssinus]|uniref:Uncharacterized protein n=1 Tax=Dermatophagoides pteronyssinus TaxID=6956 RepID=A0ABQ8J1D0_DERPT|nr:hypothetical protein DERP_000880 [Dermatophagoides pteronyssinus]